MQKTNIFRSKATIRPKLSRDDIIMRAGIFVIAVYLLLSLVVPLYTMFSKSFSIFQYDLSKYEVQVSDEEGQFNNEILSLDILNRAVLAVKETDLSAGSGGRLGVTTFFPDFNFRSSVIYRIRNTDEQGRFLIGSTLITGGDWQELDSNTFRRVQLRPFKSTGLANFVN